MKQQIISLLERAKENGRTIGDVLAEVRGMRPVCLTCDDHGWIGGPSFYEPDEGGEPCPDCTSSPAAPAAAERAPVADERAAFKKCHAAIIKAISSIARTDGPDTRKEDDPELLYRSPVMDEVVRIRGALDEYSAALASATVARAIQWPTMPASKGQSPVLFEDGYAEGWAKCMDECRRAVSQASAPVAGEAVGKVVLFGGDVKEVSWTGGKMPPPGTTLYAAPQASPSADGRDALNMQQRLDDLYVALEVCSAELFAQCGDQGRAMKYVEQARKALAAEQCARASQKQKDDVIVIYGDGFHNGYLKGRADGYDAAAKDVGLPDVLDAALNNLLHDNYERSYSGGKNREADVALIRAAIAAKATGEEQ